MHICINTCISCGGSRSKCNSVTCRFVRNLDNEQTNTYCSNLAGFENKRDDDDDGDDGDNDDENDDDDNNDDDNDDGDAADNDDSIKCVYK